MVRASWQRAREIANGPKTEWPACRMTHACTGRHVPNSTELGLVTQRKQPTLPRPPAKVGKARFFGPRV